MNDRFKFRVFDKETGKYYKSRISKGSGCVVYQHPSSGHCQWVQISTLFAELEQDEKIYARTGVEPEKIIEQCTGLKDKNGKLIYEGDIVSGRYFNPYHPDTPNPKIKGVVCFVENRMTWIVEDGDEGYDFEDCMPTKEYFEIIGNVHEQAEQKDK